MWGLGLDWYGVEEEQFWGCCGHGHEHLVCHKMWGISRIVVELQASQEGLCSMM